MNKSSQLQYVLVAYALKGTMSTIDLTNYLCNKIEVPTSGATPERSINAYVAQNTKENTHGSNHRGSWFSRLEKGIYCLDCTQDLKSRILYIKNAKYDISHANVFSENDFNAIVSEFLEKDPTLDKNQILEYCGIESIPTSHEKSNKETMTIIDTAGLQKVIASYKEAFVNERWEDEKYKWVAVKHFQDNWNIEAQDFAAMLKTALAKTYNLLVSASRFPGKMIEEFAEVAPEQVRAMFRELFDESKDIWQRVKSFKEKSQPLLEVHGKNAKNHYQDENAISTYLWLRYPDTYYMYKISEIKAVARELNSDLAFKNGQYEDNIRNFIELYNAIRLELLKDEELKALLKSRLTEDCYADDELYTLTTDFGYYISRRYGKDEETSDSADADAEETSEISIEKYDSNKFFSEVFMTQEKYDAIIRRLKAKKNIILQGAPGVGKTFAAKRLAYSIMGEKDENRIEFVQFHQNYSYEDFVMGYKPNENGFELRNGIFYSFCQTAANDPDNDYFFIIDEINRGNMSKIFGELLMLIEKDYRDTSLKLAYNGLSFHVPSNLYIIGMMNTADRSLAMIDYALRRRFSFFDMEPGFDSDGFKAYQTSLNHEKFDKLTAEIIELNRAITEDKSLGKGFCIGHSYLCGAEICSDEWLQGVVEYDILPMLAEYWFDELEEYEKWKKRLMDVVK